MRENGGSIGWKHPREIEVPRRERGEESLCVIYIAIQFI